MVLVALVVLVACPAGSAPRYSYVCTNGTGADATFDASAGGLTRCASCNVGYRLESGVCRANNYVCANGTPSSLRDATADGSITRCASCNLLYRLDGTTDVVGRSCGEVAVGEATRIGMVSQFGVGETGPAGLGAIGNTLYMLGQTNDAPYTLNIDPADNIPNGMATRVGAASVTNFGANESIPTGLAAISNTLYMVGATKRVLYTLDTGTGMAAQVGATTAGFNVGEDGPHDLAAIGNTLYMVGEVTDVLYTLNTTSGVATRVSDVSVSQFGVGENRPRSLAAIGNTLYMAGLANDVLYTLNITSGDGTPDGMAIQVGTTPAGFGVGETSPTGLAAIGDTLYMVGFETDALYALRYQ